MTTLWRLPIYRVCKTLIGCDDYITSGYNIQLALFGSYTLDPSPQQSSRALRTEDRSSEAVRVEDVTDLGGQLAGVAGGAKQAGCPVTSLVAPPLLVPSSAAWRRSCLSPSPSTPRTDSSSLDLDTSVSLLPSPDFVGGLYVNLCLFAFLVFSYICVIQFAVFFTSQRIH